MPGAKSVLFVAHDIGSGRVLTPVAAACEAAGYQAPVIAVGPASAVLKNTVNASGSALPEPKDLGRFLSAQKPATIVTGTSASASLEQDAWAAARALGVPSIAIIDAAMNYSKRLERSTGKTELPDVICVVDAESQRQLSDLVEISTRIEIVGQPHLEHVGRKVGWHRHERRHPRQIIFFSEPIVAEPGERHRIGFEQFEVFGNALPGFAETVGMSLAVKPHPNEDVEQWQSWISHLDSPPQVTLSVTTQDALELMRQADGVFGMCSMALVEASLAGIPALALQPARYYVPNSIIDESTSIMLETDPATLVETTRRFVRDIEAGALGSAPANPYLGSTARVMKVISQTLEPNRPGTASARASGENL
jgi:hypothetical protein